MSTNAKYINGMPRFYDPALDHETEHVIAPVSFYDDFVGVGSIAIPSAGGAESGMPWVKGVVAANETIAGSLTEPNGVVACALTSDSEAQTAALYQNNALHFNATQGLQVEARVKLSVLPTLVAEAVFGVCGTYNAVPDTITYSAFFKADGNGAILCEADDNATNSSEASGVTVLATEWHVYRIDFTDVTNVRFFIDGNEVANGIPWAASAANSKVQLYAAGYKASGAGVGTIQVDYFRAWQKRS